MLALHFLKSLNAARNPRVISEIISFKLLKYNLHIYFFYLPPSLKANLKFLSVILKKKKIAFTDNHSFDCDVIPIPTFFLIQNSHVALLCLERMPLQYQWKILRNLLFALMSERFLILVNLFFFLSTLEGT